MKGGPRLSEMMCRKRRGAIKEASSSASRLGLRFERLRRVGWGMEPPSARRGLRHGGRAVWGTLRGIREFRVWCGSEYGAYTVHVSALVQATAVEAGKSRNPAPAPLAVESGQRFREPY